MRRSESEQRIQSIFQTKEGFLSRFVALEVACSNRSSPFPPSPRQVISHQTHLNNLLLNSTLLTQRPSSPPGGSNVVYLPPTTSSKRTRTGANATLTTPLRKEKARKVANPDGGGRGGGKKDRETTEFMDEWYDSNSHKQSPGKGVASGSGRAGGGAKKKR